MKRGAIGLSVNMIVLIIISLAIFGFGMSFLWGLISDAQQIKSDLDAKTEQQLEYLLIEQGRRVAISANTIATFPGESITIGLGILNIGDSKELHIETSLSKYIEESSIEGFADVTSWLLYDDSEFKLADQESKNEPIQFNVPKDARKGQYIFNVKVCGLPSCTLENQYGNTQKFSLTIK